MNYTIPDWSFKILSILFKRLKIDKHKSNTNRAIELIKSTHECNLEGTNEFLNDFYYRKLSAEIYGFELEKYRLTIAKKTIENSGYQIRWDIIKTALPYLIFSENKMKVNYNKCTSFTNWMLFIIAMIILTIPLCVMLYIGWNNISITLSKSFTLGGAIIGCVALGLAMLFSTADFFAARRIKKLLK